MTDPVRSTDDVAALAARADRIETPCGDGTLAWRCWGDPSGAPVVLLHGGSGSWTHWVRNVDALVRAGRRVVVPDMPGFGESAAPPDGDDADAIAPWLERGLDGVLGAVPVAVVGFSFGGLTAGIWATQQPGRFARLVLVGAPGLCGGLLPPLGLRRWDTVAEGAPREAVHRHNLRQLMLAHDASADALAVSLHAANVVRDRLRNRRLMRTDLLARLLPGIDCPVAGLCGAQDPLYRGRLERAESIFACAPRGLGLVSIPDAGHWVQFEAPDAFDEALAAALGATDSADTAGR
jgi:2-hydroxy-6-oxonona-2,4-dienedioate hydrolase